MVDETPSTDENSSDPLPGPRGQRMMQLGILTKGQKRKPVIPNVRTGADGKPNPGDERKAEYAQSLADKAQAQKQALLNNGPANMVPEMDPMKKSLVPRPPAKPTR